MNPLKRYLNEGVLQIMERQSQTLNATMRQQQKLVSWAKHESFKTIAVSGLAATVKQAQTELLRPVQVVLNDMHDLARHHNDQLFSGVWESVAEKYNELDVQLRKLANVCPKVRNQRDLDELTTAWSVWGVDYQDLVELLGEAVSDFDAQIEELYNRDDRDAY